MAALTLDISKPTCRQHPDLVHSFLRATARGFRFAAQHPERAADMLLAAAPGLDASLVHASQASVSKARVAAGVALCA